MRVSVKSYWDFIYEYRYNEIELLIKVDLSQSFFLLTVSNGMQSIICCIHCTAF